MQRVLVFAALLAAALPANGQDQTEKQMVAAIVENCLPRVSDAIPMPTDGLVQGPGGHHSPDGSVAVLDTSADFACQVLARAQAGPVGDALAAWTETSDYVLIGRIPFTASNLRGLFIYGPAKAGGFVQIHIANLPDGRLGALLTRADQNQDAERALQ